MAERTLKSFDEFWPFYVGEHRRPANRALHFIGTSCALLALLSAVTTGRVALLALAPVGGYLFAWLGHFVVEKNRPATFTYPLWSLAADFVMYAKIWTRTMEGEVRAINAAAAAGPPPPSETR